MKCPATISQHSNNDKKTDMKDFSDTLHAFAVGLLVSIVLAMPRISVAQQYDLPPLAKVGDGAVIEAEQIFDIANKPTRECHASTIVETPTGLVAAWFAGTREKHPDVGIWISRKADGSMDRNLWRL